MKKDLQQFGVTNQYWITMYIVSTKEVRQEKKESIEVMSQLFRIWCVLSFFGRFGGNQCHEKKHIYINYINPSVDNNFL